MIYLETFYETIVRIVTAIAVTKRCIQRSCSKSAVNLFAVANLDHEDPTCAILNVADDSIVANPVAPIGAEHRPCLGFAGVTWIPWTGNAFIHEIKNASRGLLVELAKLPCSRLGAVNRPGQATDWLQESGFIFASYVIQILK